jgi:hypothetical protein
MHKAVVLIDLTNNQKHKSLINLTNCWKSLWADLWRGGTVFKIVKGFGF